MYNVRNDFDEHPGIEDSFTIGMNGFFKSIWVRWWYRCHTRCWHFVCRWGIGPIQFGGWYVGVLGPRVRLPRILRIVVGHNSGTQSRRLDYTA